MSDYYGDLRDYEDYMRKDDDDVLDDDELPTDGYDLYKNYMQMQDQLDHPRYSHRNGETEPPTEEGWYWIADDQSASGKEYENPYPARLTKHYRRGRHNELEDAGMGFSTTDYLVFPSGARFYGPIPQPTVE